MNCLAGRDTITKILDIIYHNPPLNPHEITALELYDQFCSSLEMKKEDDKIVSSAFFKASSSTSFNCIPKHYSLRTQIFLYVGGIRIFYYSRD